MDFEHCSLDYMKVQEGFHFSKSEEEQKNSWKIDRSKNSFDSKFEFLKPEVGHFDRKKLTEWDAGDATGLIIGDGDIPVKKKFFFLQNLAGIFK